MWDDFIISTLRLFKALPIKGNIKKEKPNLLKLTLPYGFVFSPEVVGEYSEKGLFNLANEISDHPEQINTTFHKSWNKIKTATIEQLVIEQIIHYITTYGFEALGFYSDKTVYIPAENLKIPEINIDIFKITVIKGYTIKQFEEKILNLLQSGIALHGDTQKDLFEIIAGLNLKIDPEIVKNKEMRILLFDLTGRIPRDPTEFLRYLLHKSINTTLLIKNVGTIEQIKGYSNQQIIIQLFNHYAKTHGLEKLATIFFRFKPLFLAFRTYSGLAPVINKIRKLANKHHKPMPVDYLNEVTARISRGEPIATPLLNSKLKDVNIFRKIRIAYALKYRTGDFEAIMYKIRNGKSFSTDFKFKEQKKAKEVLDIVLKSIIKDLKINVKGKEIYIPKYMTYTLPATEKMFTGNFPTGSFITIPKDIIFGIHWTDVNNSRIDLDLSLMTQNGKYGWDALYRSYNGDIMFSGDVTSAPKPKGATELFYVQKQNKTTALMFVNYFNFQEKIPVPYSIVVGSKAIGQFNRDFMLDPNTILARANSSMDKKQKLLGLLTVSTKECKFYFNESYLGKSISAAKSEYVNKSRDYLVNYLSNMITLNDLLKEAGAIIVDAKDEGVLSLAPEDLEKDTIINLLIPKNI
jgi:hypothetical protein